MMQHYWDARNRCVICADPLVAPVEGAWLPVTEQDADALRKQHAVRVPRSARIRKEIDELEASITPRRLREALLSRDTSFIASVEERITALRTELRGLP